MNARTPRERWLLGGMLTVFLVTAFFSEAPFHPDEYFQVLEWTGFKLGFVPRDAMPWEHGAMIRPWFLPGVYFMLAKVFTAVGGANFFTFATLARIASSLFSFAATVRLFDFSKTWLEERHHSLHALVFATAGMLPYLAARTSSENLGASFFIFAFVLLQTSGSDALSASRSLAGGFLLGLSFESRYQMAFMALGLLGHVAFVERASMRVFWACLGSVLALMLGALVDRWGYGTWSFPPLAYLRQNLAEGRAATFGTDPFFAYPYLVVVNVFFPAAIVLVLTQIVCWVRHPRHVLTFVTLPFFVGHSLIGHKEERFLFPLVPLLIAGFLFIVLPATSPRLNALLARLHARPLVFRAIWAHQIAVMLFLAFVPFGWRPNVGLSRAIVEAQIPLPVERIGSQRFQEYFFLQRGARLFRQEDAQGAHLPSAATYVAARSPVLTEIEGREATLIASQAFPVPFGRSLSETVRRGSGWAKRKLGLMPEIGCPSLYRLR